MYVLGIDSGGTLSKAALYDGKGQELAITSKLSKIINPKPHFVEKNMDALWRDIIECIQGVLKKSQIKGKDIKGIAVSSHGKGLYCLDKDHNPLMNGVMSSDTRALSLVQTLKNTGISDKVYDLVWQPLWTAHPASILTWFAKNQPKTLDQTSSILMGHDYIRYKLTGEIGAELTNMSGSALVDSSTADYSSEVLHLLGLTGIEEKLPPLIGSTEQAGTVTKACAELTGLEAGTPVFGGFFDVVAAAIASSLLTNDEINAIMGTWSISTCITDTIVDKDHHHAWGNYCIPNKFFVHDGSPSSANNLEWYINNINPHNDFKKNDQILERISPDSQDIFFYPFLYSSNITDKMPGSLLGLRSSHTQDNITYALYEGILYAHKMHLENIYRIQNNPTHITLTGGPTKSHAWMQMFSNILNTQVNIPDVTESGCKGAAIAALVGTAYYKDFNEASANTSKIRHIYTPQKNLVDAFRNKYESYKALGTHIGNFFE